MKLYVWGCGRRTASLIGSEIKEDMVTAFIDSDPAKTEWLGRPVLRPAAAAQSDYDAVLVPPLASAEIHDQAAAVGFDLRKLLFLGMNCRLVDLNQDYDLLARVLGESYAARVRRNCHLVRQVQAQGKLPLEEYENSRGGVLRHRFCAHEDAPARAA